MTLPATEDTFVTLKRGADVSVEPTMRATPMPSTPGHSKAGLGVSSESIPEGELGARYELGTAIGRGGMGEVRAARDARIDREVAVKLMRHADKTEADVLRFFREARVQGALEHPSVVPVHDLGIDRENGPYFVMKRLTGTTLQEVLTSKDPSIRDRWEVTTLLDRLSDVCLAVELAHTRGVIHRDLKPANIMLGDFGEVYVLDWGLARITADAESLEGVMPLSGDHGSMQTETQAGALLGTPGYMSPEQVRGEAVTAATDVFALGMTLYEIVAGIPALPRGMAALPGTLEADEHRPSTVTPTVPPELDQLCADATNAEPAKRPTARELSSRIDQFVRGDRDTARRKQLAATHARKAAEALATSGLGGRTTSMTESGGMSTSTVRDASDEARALATREAGRALSLDPTNSAAGAILAKLLIEAPTKLPAEALAQAQAARAEARRAVFVSAQWGFLSLIALTLSILFLGPRIVWPVVLAAAVATGMWLVTRRLAREAVDGRSLWFVLLGVFSATLLFMAGVLFGPFLVLPAFLIGSIAGFLSQPTDFKPWIPVSLMCFPLVLVVVLEHVGIIPHTTSFVNGALLITSPIIDLTPFRTVLLVGASILTQIVNTVFLFVSTMKVQREAQNRIHAQRWHLEQLLPLEDAQSTLPKPRSKVPTRRPADARAPTDTQKP
jgi:serine/threonine-protein kinase